MKFQKINDKVIRCVITREEMDNAGIEIEDLMDNRGKAEEFLKYVLNQARLEVDYVTNGDVLNVQLSVMHDGEISMMISDDHNAAIRAIAEQFHQKLADFKAVLDSAKKSQERVNETPAQKKEKVFKSILEHAKDKDKIDFDFWAKLSSMDKCMELANALNDIRCTYTNLYKYNDSYYLNMVLSVPKLDVAKNAFIMSEYSDSLNAANNSIPAIKEHGDLIIKDDALEVLQYISQ